MTTKYEQMNDCDLIFYSRKGIEPATRELFRRYTPLIRKLAHAPHVRTAAEDIESLLRCEFAYAIQNYDPARNIPPAGWFATRLRYAMWNRFKKLRRRWQHEIHVTAEPAIAGDSVADTAVQHDEIHRLREALKQLSPRQREVIHCLYYEELSRNATARALGCSPQAVSDTKKRALAILRTLLTEK